MATDRPYGRTLRDQATFRFVLGDAFIVPANATLLCEHTRSTDDIYLGVPPDLLASGAADLGETFHTPEALADFGAPDAVLQHIAFALLRERAAPGLGATRRRLGCCPAC